MIKETTISLAQLKKICKFLNLKNYSKLTKITLLAKINTHLSIIKLQRFFRSFWIDDGLCPVSMEEIKYPCYAFKPKGFMIDKCKRNGTSFIYYNLEPLVNYLISSGDFRDPKTREPYSEIILKSIDKCRVENKLKFKSVYKASVNKTKYRRKKEKEEDLIVLERCIDEVVSSIRLILEKEQVNRDNDPRITLNSFHFPTFHRYFRNMLYKSKEYANQVLKRTINIITGPEERPTQDPNEIKDFILQFIYTLDATYFE